MTTLNGTKFHDTLFDSALSDLMLGIAGNIEPTASELDLGVKSRVAHEGPTDNDGDSLVATALLHGDFSSLAESAAGGNGNEAKIVGFVDGTSNTAAFAENNVVENVNVKYTFSGAEDDPVAGLKFDTDVVDVVTDNKDPELLVADAVAGGSGNGVLDGISGNGDNALGTRGGGEVIADFSSYVTNGTTGTVDSGKPRLVDINGTSNTLIVGRTDVVNTNLLETMPDDDNALFKGSVVNINAGGGWDPIYLSDLPRTDEANGSANATTGTVSDSGDDARSAGVADGLSNTVMFGRTDSSAPSNVVEAVATKYTMFDGEPGGLLLGGSGAVLDVGDVLIGVDAADDDGNDPLQTLTAGGSTTHHADPDGQANGIIAVLIGLRTDIQGPLTDGSLPLD